MPKRPALSVLAATMLAALSTGDARGQEADDGDAAQPITLPTLKVSAQKRLESPSEVPISLTVFDDQQLLDADIEDIDDLTRQTPNFSEYKTGGRGHTTTLNMRGVTSSNADFANPTVGVFVDGMRYSGGYDFDFYDTERVEVLRGPQGTLYGGNSPAGVLNIVSKRPSFEWEANGDVTIESFGTFQERFAAGGPIDDKLAFRVTGVKLNSNGYIDNATTGGDGETRDDLNFRAQLLFKPTPRWDVLLSLSGWDYSGTFASYAPISQLESEPHTVYSNEGGHADQNAFAQVLDISYSGEQFDFTSISGHRYWRSVEKLDADYTADQLAFDRSNKSNDQFSQELRLSSPDGAEGPLQWLVGAHFAYETQTSGDQFTYWPPLFGATTESTDAGEMTIDQRNAAVFGQATYAVTDKLFVTAGARYDYVHKKVTSNAEFRTPTATFENPTLTGSKSFSAFLPKLALEYRWTPQINTYATITRGYKPGGFPSFNFRAGNEPYESEYTWNYEIGAKTSLFDNRLQVDASLFYIDIKDQQFTTLVRPNVTAIGNIGKSHSKGFEITASGLVAPGWEIFGNVGYADAKIDELDQSTSGAVEGGRPANVPLYTATLGTQYRGPSGLFARVDGTLVGPYYLDGGNNVSQDNFFLLNAKLGWEFENFDVYGFVDNLLDETYLTRAFGGTLPGQGFVGRQGAPLTVGVMARARF